MKKYKQLTHKEMILIERLYNVENKSIRQIAKELGRDPGTISRHINKYKTVIAKKSSNGNYVEVEQYSADYAYLETNSKRRKLKNLSLFENEELVIAVKSLKEETK